MTIQIPLDEDHHVHSSFSDDAVSTLDQNVAAARQRGPRVLCLAEHVRRDSDWVPGYLAAVEALRPVPGLAVLAGERACPSPRTVRAFAAAGVPLVASTDSHDCRDIGVYSAVRQLAGGISPDPVR